MVLAFGLREGDLVHLSKDPFNICRLALRGLRLALRPGLRLALRGLGIEISSSCRGRCEEI